MKLIALIGIVIAILSVILRMVSRAVGEGTFLQNSGMDDAFLLMAMIPVVGISACSVIRKLGEPHVFRWNQSLTRGSHGQRPRQGPLDGTV